MTATTTTATEAQTRLPRIVLIGSPNSGKTTLFNRLTGARQRTGNYPGITVDHLEGHLIHGSSQEGNPIIVDLPGLYSLIPRSPDEALALAALNPQGDNPLPDLILAVADGNQLERQLYLILELRERGFPMALAITLQDLAELNGIHIDAKLLSALLGFPVFLVSARDGRGLTSLTSALAQVQPRHEETNLPHSGLPSSDEVIQARYRYIEDLIRRTVKASRGRGPWQARIDSIVLHPVFGPTLLFGVFALLFQSVFSLAKIPMDWISSQIDGFGSWLGQALPPGFFNDLLSQGIVGGVGAVVVFLPQILLLFLFIYLLEDSGYLARAALILDRIMKRFGLSGRSFVPLLSSFACAVPGILAARTLERRRDRIITMMMAPLMTCSARLPIYTLFIGAFISDSKIFGPFTWQGLVLFGLYGSSILVALLVSFVLGKTAFREGGSDFFIELPAYQWPVPRNIVLGLYTKAKSFLWNAGTIILALSVLLWIAGQYPKMEVTPANEALPSPERAALQLEQSYMGRAGKLLEPFVKPLGFDWKIGVGLVASFAAREVLVSTLSTVYAVGEDTEEQTGLASRLKQARDPLTGAEVFTIPTVLSLLVFYMLACQCISTLAVVKRETKSLRWPTFLFLYMTGLAYIASLATYHLASRLF